MIWQYIIVAAIIFTALSLTVYRLVRFFRTPASHCAGCSGCKLEDLKTVRKA